MFGRKKTVTARADTAGHQLGGYEAVTALVARPDGAAIDRVETLNARVGATLRGYSGTVVRYDRGDPVVSLTGPVQSVPYAPVAAALAQIGRPSAVAGVAVPEFSSLAFTDPSLDPWNALLWQRLQAGQ